jgi:hypothetical protein
MPKTAMTRFVVKRKRDSDRKTTAKVVIVLIVQSAGNFVS